MVSVTVRPVDPPLPAAPPAPPPPAIPPLPAAPPAPPDPIASSPAHATNARATQAKPMVLKHPPFFALPGFQLRQPADSARDFDRRVGGIGCPEQVMDV